MRSSLFFSSWVFLLICFRSSVFFFSSICVHLFFQMPICETFPLPFFFFHSNDVFGVVLENNTNDKESPPTCTWMIQSNFWTNNIIYHETSTETNPDSTYEDLKEQDSMKKREAWRYYDTSEFAWKKLEFWPSHRIFRAFHLCFIHF